jgi:UDP-N-acetylmuramoyl-tripeptide--D-alanyl-D-alanine ligase
MDLTLEQIARAVGGRSLGADATASGFAFDSRTLVAGEGFVAIRAERDGHDFVRDAAANGATLALVDHEVPGLDLPQVVVEDTLRALQALAAEARTQLEGVPVVGVTGSAGKTSTKDLTAAALRARFEVQASAASFNNEIGLPVTILGTPPGTEALVPRDGRPLRRQHRRAVRDRPAHDRRRHQRRARARRVPRRSRRRRPGEGRAPRGPPGRRVSR